MNKVAVGIVATLACWGGATALAEPPEMMEWREGIVAAHDVDASLDVPWVIAIVATHTELSPAALLGLRSGEVLCVDAADPGHVEVVSQALLRWRSPAVLVLTDAAEVGREVQGHLIQQSEPLREALATGSASFELVTTSGNGTFIFRGPHPDLAPLAIPPVEVQPAAPEEHKVSPPADRPGDAAVLAAGLMSAPVTPSAPDAVAALASKPEPELAQSLASPAGSGMGRHLSIAGFGLLATMGVVAWFNRDRLSPTPRRLVSAGPMPQSTAFHSSNARLAAAVNRLRDKLRQSTQV